MIKLIAGPKGTGKTAKLVDDINAVAASDSNVVCLERGNRLDQLLKPTVRLVNMKEYPIEGLIRFSHSSAASAPKITT